MKNEKIFDRIAGYKKEKEELLRLCEVIRNRDEYRQKGARPPKGIVFYGEAGTGKTLFATVMAEYCGLPLIKISPAESADPSGVNEAIKRATEQARSHPNGSIVYFDELDKVLPNDDEEYYTDASKTALIQLLTFIDGMDSIPNTVFIATCNYYASLPQSLTRAGRLDKKMRIGLPTAQSREAIIKMYTERSKCRFELSAKEIAKLCKGFSCAALETMVNECIIHSKSDGTVTAELIKRSVCEINSEDIPRTLSPEDAAATAYRNAGCLAVARLLCPESDYTLALDNKLGNDFYIALTESSTYDEDDYYDDDYDDDETDGDEPVSRNHFTKTDYLNAITVLLGGYAAEEFIVGELYGNLSVIHGNVDTLLLCMAQNGMLGLANVYLSSRNDCLPYTTEKADHLNRIFDEITEECYRKATAIIRENTHTVKLLAQTLIERTYLSKNECEALLQG
ncbi:MAG: AAA family ATPase [Clostridia bacterium]|nr:AAA family ATPase [Clostridia bacterium]